MEKRKDKRDNVTIAVCCTIFVALILFVFFLLTNKKETHLVGETKNSDLSAIVCTATNQDSAFFVSETATTQKHELKILFSDGSVNKLNYFFNGEYESGELAHQDHAVLIANYNNYMGDHEQDPNSLAPVFKENGEKLNISLYLDDVKNLNFVNRKLFFVESGDVNKIQKYSVDEVKEYFRKKGFSCIISK